MFLSAVSYLTMLLVGFTLTSQEEAEEHGAFACLKNYIMLVPSRKTVG